MTDFLPLFPLKMVVFPREPINLHIFEPRYKQLIREASENGTTFGIPVFLNGKVMSVGTEIQLLNIENIHDNGEMDIKTRGLGQFRIDKFYKEAPNKLYAGGDITRLENKDDGSVSISVSIIEKLREFFKTLKISKPLPKNPEFFSTFSWAHYIGLNINQEYEMLCIRSEYERQEYMLAHLDKILPMVNEMNRLKKKAKLNGHFKNVIPPKF